MSKLKTLAVTCALAGLAFQGCDRNDGDSSHADPTESSWDFKNTADPATFKAKLADLEKLSNSANRGKVPADANGDFSQTDYAWGLLDSYAGKDPETGVPSSEAQPAAGCAQLQNIFGLGARAETSGSGFALTDGASCNTAVREMKSYYSQSLDALKQQVSWLKTLAPGTIVCGMRVEETPVDAASAAVGYKLVPTEVPAGMHFDQRMFGAANDTQVGYLTSISAGCSSAAGDCNGSPDFSIVGRTQAVGLLAEKKLQMSNEFAFTMAFDDPKHGGKQDITTSMQSQSEVSGLGDTDLLKATELTSFELIGDPSAAPGAGPYKVSLALNVEEIGEGRLRVSGSFTTNDSNQTPQAFKVEFQRTGAYCSVNTRVPDSESSQDPGLPGVPFDNEKLKGTWTSECDAASLGNFGYQRYLESAQFDGTNIVRKLTSYSDSECFPGKEAVTVTLSGGYSMSTELPDNSRYDEFSEYGLNLKYATLQIVLNTQSLVDQFNSKVVCNKSDWALGATKTFPAGECYFDVGNEPLLNSYVMQNTSEYTAFQPMSDLARLDLAQSSFFSGDSVASRSRITGTKRTLKHAN